MNKIRIDRNVIVVTCDRGDSQTQATLSQFYPVHSNRLGTEFALSVRMLPEVLKALRGVTEDNIESAPEKVQHLYNIEMTRRSALEHLLTYGPSGNPVVNSHLTLEPHQQLGREISQVFERFGFFYDTRTGKTPMSLAIINDDIQKHPEHKWLVVCPLILIDNAWLEDAAKFFPDMRIISCHASTPQKRVERINSDANVYVTNTESFVKYREHFKDIHGCFIDESSDMKSYKSKVSAELVDFARTLERFYLLSGTPAPNGEWEYYMQMRALDYYCMPQFVTHFKQYYFTNISYNPQFEKLALRPDRRDDLLKVIKKYALFVDKEDVLETAGRDFLEVEYDAPEELMVHYRKMKNELYTEIGDRQIISKSVATKLNKLNQISSGFVMDTQAAKENEYYNENQQVIYRLDDTRFQKMLELLDKHRDEQILIWANYREEFTRIKELLGDSCRCVYGGTTILEKNEAIKLFKEGKIQYLIANPASADKGLTLTNAHICIYFSLTWSYELFKQSTERIYGAKSRQPKRCIYYILEAKHTIDRILYNDVLQGKATASHAVLDHLKGGL